jgi:anaerobic selenocysteine-containing dehydrogenase
VTGAASSRSAATGTTSRPPVTPAPRHCGWITIRTVILPARLENTPAVHTSDEFPFILAAGQRRAFTANTIIRDATWRLRERDGTLRLNPGDAERLGLPDGATAQITASRGTARATVEADDPCNPATPPCPTASASICPRTAAAPNAPASPSTPSPTSTGATLSP